MKGCPHLPSRAVVLLEDYRRRLSPHRRPLNPCAPVLSGDHRALSATTAPSAERTTSSFPESPPAPGLSWALSGESPGSSRENPEHSGESRADASRVAGISGKSPSY